MRKETEEKTFDTRLVERNIYKGRLSPKDYDKYIKGLDDSAENAEEIDLSEKEEAESEESILEPETQDSFDDEITL